MKTKYARVDTSTMKGQKYAEWLYAHGWSIVSSGLFIVTFQKRE